MNKGQQNKPIAAFPWSRETTALIQAEWTWISQSWNALLASGLTPILHPSLIEPITYPGELLPKR